MILTIGRIFLCSKSDKKIISLTDSTKFNPLTMPSVSFPERRSNDGEMKSDFKILEAFLINKYIIKYPG